MRRLIMLIAFLALLVGAASGGFASTAQASDLSQDATPTPEARDSPEEAEAASEMDEGGGEYNVQIPFLDVWLASAHADREAEAFVHWNEDDPQEVPSRCARCHSSGGYQDYLGVDGTEAGVVDSGHPVGTVVDCVTCHNSATTHLDAVTFPSGLEISNIGSSARCMVCHQGRASGLDVSSAIEEAGLSDDLDVVSEELGFINIHYYAAAASLYGSEVNGGFQYANNVYQPKFSHVEGYDTCASCHSPHSLELKVEECAACHNGVEEVEDLKDVRMQGSMHDYDGDGDMEEGIYYEIQDMQTTLYGAMQAYALDVAGTGILYDSGSYPYFFIDGNGNGEIDEGEVSRDTRFNSWTPRLLQAAYNYQVSLKDPGNYAHNAKYHIELLFDSISSLNEAMAEPVDMAAFHRDDPGHFNATEYAFARFYGGDTPASCVKCHNGDGLPFYLEHGVNISLPATDALKCSTCHQVDNEFALYEVEEVEFPSGAVLAFEGENNVASNLCLNCHQGRESSFSIEASIIRSGAGPDEISEALRFQNPHYFAAGASLFGAEAAGAYQFDGKSYLGRLDHVSRYDTCAECHSAHSQEVKVENCADCHEFEELTDIRDEDNETDWDGDGDVTEGIAGELATMEEALFPYIIAYTTDVIGSPAAYDSHSYPYWFNDLNGNGEVDPEEADRSNAYASWTPTMLRAAYNYQWVAKDPGGYAHNGMYLIQVLYDTLEAIGGEEAVAGMTRPVAEE